MPSQNQKKKKTQPEDNQRLQNRKVKVENYESYINIYNGDALMCFGKTNRFYVI